MSAIVHARGRVSLIAGLEWRQLFQPAGRARDAEIREMARDNGVHRLALVARGERVFAGLVPDLDEEGDASPRGASGYSVAAILAQMAGEELVVAALHVPELRRVAVVAVEQGAPSIDVVQGLQKAHETVTAIRAGEHGFAGHRLFTNDRAEFPEAEELSLDALADAAGPAVRLQRPPVNGRALALAALAGLAVLGAGVAGKLYWDHRAKQEQLRAARQADPVPKYQAELARQIQRLGIPTAALAAWGRGLLGQPVWAAGWALQSITCTPDECVSEWERHGGTTQGLSRARASEKLDVANSSADRALLRWNDPALKASGWRDMSPARPREQAEAAQLAVWQSWTDARIRLQQTGPFVPWPNTGQELPAEVTLKARALEATMPFPLLQDALAHTPPDVWWNEVRLKVDASGKEQALLVTLKGNAYVR